MPVIQTNLFEVVHRFPDRKDTVRGLFKKSEMFQTLCEDYRQCTEALRRWGSSQLEEAPAREAEYSALLNELEEEILKNLNEYEQIR